MLKLGVTKSSESLLPPSQPILSHTHTLSVMQLSSGSTSSLPTLKKLQGPPQTPSKHHPLERKATKSQRTRRPSSAGAPPLLHVIQQADKMVAVKEEERVQPGETGWEYCSLSISTEMAECLAGQSISLSLSLSVMLPSLPQVSGERLSAATPQDSSWPSDT